MLSALAVDCLDLYPSPESIVSTVFSRTLWLWTPKAATANICNYTLCELGFSRGTKQTGYVLRACACVWCMRVHGARVFKRLYVCLLVQLKLNSNMLMLSHLRSRGPDSCSVHKPRYLNSSNLAANPRQALESRWSFVHDGNWF